MTMHKHLAVILTVMLILGVMVPAGVLAEEVDGAFSFTLSDGKATVTDYDVVAGGTMVVVPGTLDGNPVIGIDEEAFADKGLVLVSLPDGLERIGPSAFADNLLEALVLPDSVSDIGARAFSGNSLNDLTLGSGLESIGDEAFRGNELTALSLPWGIQNIGQAAFADNELTEALVPDSVTEMGAEVFQDNQEESVDLTIFGREDSTAEDYAGEYGHAFALYYEVRFLDDDEEETLLGMDLVPAGRDATAPAPPEQDGRSFSGWDTGFLNVEEDLDIVALYDLNAYVVTFAVLGGNGTLTARVDGESIRTGDAVSAGKDVAFWARPDDGYRVKQWRLNGTILEEETARSFSWNDLQDPVIVRVVFESIEDSVIALPGREDGFPAAPAIANRILRENNLGNRYPTGTFHRNGREIYGNYISEVARQMRGTDFMGVSKTDRQAYIRAVVTFLRDLGADL